MTQLEKGFFVYCRELGRGEEKFRIGTAMMADIGGDHSHDTLYIMIPVKPEVAKRINRVFFLTSSIEKLVEIEVDRISQETIEGRDSDGSR